MKAKLRKAINLLKEFIVIILIIIALIILIIPALHLLVSFCLIYLIYRVIKKLVGDKFSNLIEELFEDMEALTVEFGNSD